MSFWVVFIQTNSGQLSGHRMTYDVGEDSDGEDAHWVDLLLERLHMSFESYKNCLSQSTARGNFRALDSSWLPNKEMFVMVIDADALSLFFKRGCPNGIGLSIDVPIVERDKPQAVLDAVDGLLETWW